jgi:hypothetical protein
MPAMVLHDRRDDVLELRVTHVRVDLRRVPRARGGKPAGFDGPREILISVLLPEREAFAKRGLVDLDDADPGGFEVANFLPDRQRDLPAGHPARLVLANERPLEYRHRPRQHPLARFVGERLGEAGPLDRHRPRREMSP